MREKDTTPKGKPRDIASGLNSFVSVIHASSLDAPQLPSQASSTASNPYCYIPGQYWQTLDYYDMAMDICTDYSRSQIPLPLMSDSISPNTTDDLTPLESPLDFMPEAFGSPGDSLRLMRTDSSLLESPGPEGECPNLGRCASQQLQCDICSRDKKERRKEQNRKAQRNHRLRSEAKLDQLRAKVKTQADEIHMLRDFNQSLRKHIDTLEGKSKDEDGGTTESAKKVQEAESSSRESSGSP